LSSSPAMLVSGAVPNGLSRARSSSPPRAIRSSAVPCAATRATVASGPGLRPIGGPQTACGAGLQRDDRQVVTD
jgi:hypothetical protein